MRARKFASRKLLVSASPVETQLSIQTRAIASYSSGCAERMVGGMKSFLQIFGFVIASVAKQSSLEKYWIASSQVLLAMTILNGSAGNTKGAAKWPPRSSFAIG